MTTVCKVRNVFKLLLAINIILLVVYVNHHHLADNADTSSDDRVTHTNVTGDDVTANSGHHPRLVVKLEDTVRVDDEQLWTENFQVPNIVHYNWFTDKDKQFTFHHMLSVLSVIKYLKPDAVRFHCNKEPFGRRWEYVKTLPLFQVSPRDPPVKLFGAEIKKPLFYTSHSNVDRLKILYEQGGIYMDLDVLATNSFDDLRHYVHTVGLETKDKVCGSIIVSSNSSIFLKIWMNAYIDNYKVDTWAYNSGKVPFDLSKRFPDLVHIEPSRLNKPNYRELKEIWGPVAFDWKKNYAVHTWYRIWMLSKLFNNTEPDETNIKTWPGAFGEMARDILYDSPSMIDDQ